MNGSGVRGLLFLLAAALTASGSGCKPSQPVSTLTLATTTSVGNSGLLDGLLAPYRQATGIDVRAHLVGSGRALAMLADRHADVVISHAPSAETAALARHPRWDYRKIMFNDFVLAGPPDDPAGIAGSTDAVQAMQRIAASSARFISRGDGSGTHEREQQLWTRAGRAPSKEALIVAGAGMGTTLRAASESGAYTLTDRATFAQLRGTLELKLLYEGGPLLLNTYAVVFDPDGPRRQEAEAIARWLSDGGGRQRIENYQIGGTPAFRVWPHGRPRSNPSDLPF